MGLFRRKPNEESKNLSENLLDEKENPDLGTELPIGSHHFRAYVEPPQKYDLIAASQFNLMTSLGLRENHSFLDIGCGSLRGGRLFIPYLLPSFYYGIEPENWLLKEGIKKNLGNELIKIKSPHFSNDKNFALSCFGIKFDFILAQSIFSHATQSQVRQCLIEANKVMKPSSIFAATYVKGDENNESNEWLYPEPGTFTSEHISSMIEREGLFTKELKWAHPNNQTWIAIFKEENRNNIPNL